MCVLVGSASADVLFVKFVLRTTRNLLWPPLCASMLTRSFVPVSVLFGVQRSQRIQFTSERLVQFGTVLVGWFSVGTGVL